MFPLYLENIGKQKLFTGKGDGTFLTRYFQDEMSALAIDLVQTPLPIPSNVNISELPPIVSYQNFLCKLKNNYY